MAGSSEFAVSIRHRTKLIVGIDYGTTYSGLSFALSNAADFKDIHAWTDYPGSHSHRAGQCQKAPSWVAFKDENQELEKNAWGYEVEAGMKSYAWTKLLLDSRSLPSEYDDPQLSKAAGHGLMKLPPGKSAKDCVTEYLRGLYNMYNEAVTEMFGKDRLKDLPVDYWLTVPATWSERAKRLTKSAALDAGFGSKLGERLFLISEPEAAAHYALKSSIHHVDDLIDEGTGVMVCDLGGGTVDITTYEVTRKEPSLKLREIAVGQGGKCGGTFVDRNLYDLLAARFGSAFTSLGPEHVGPGSKFMDQFEMEKRDFCLSRATRRPYRLGLAMRKLRITPELEKFYDDAMGQVILSNADMKGLFDPVVDVILKLVGSQVDEVKRNHEPEVRTMIVVGGFGSSPYIKERLESWCAEQDIRRITPLSGAWSAVVCGAVLRGVEGSISGPKKCRRHYGHEMSWPYNPEKDFNFDENKRHLWTDPFDKTQCLSGFMEWEIAKGAVIDADTETNTSFTKTIQVSGTTETYEHELYACSLDTAPETIENDRIELVGTIEYNLHGLDVTKLQSVVDEDGEKFYKIDLVLNIRMSDEVGHLVPRILFRGREIGKTELVISCT